MDKLDEYRSQLRDFPNLPGGTRFPSSRQECPECSRKALEDNWPPNYGGGGGSWGVGGTFKSHGSQKFVCVPCRIAFRVSFKETTTCTDDGTVLGKTEVKREVTVSETVPLVEMDGKLLTPHDVSREEYKDKHGEYRVEVYG